MSDKKSIQDLFKQVVAKVKSLDKKKILENKPLIKKIVIVLVGLLVIMHIRGCIVERRKSAVQPRPVQTAIAAQKDVPVYLDSFGTLSPISSADVKSQVTGEIKEVKFKEGDDVKKGDLLFMIDPAPYQAELDKAKASLTEAQVDLKLKKDTLLRNKQLFEKELISQQDYEQFETDVAAAEAQVKLDQANVQTAEISLEYCSISAPFDGLTGKRQVDVGNLITAGSGTVLVSVKTIDKLYVDFNVPERKLPAIRGSMDQEKLKVEVTVEGDEASPYVGELSFLDNTVDDTTGTVFLRGTVPNEDRKLWPGQFVQVRLFVGTETGAVVVPYESVQLGKQGDYLFVVTPKNKADLRTVTAGFRDGDDQVIKKGVAASEKVVTVGQMGLSPGVPVIDVTEKEREKKKKKSFWQRLNPFSK